MAVLGPKTHASRAAMLVAPLCALALQAFYAAPSPAGGPTPAAEYIVEDTGLRFFSGSVTEDTFVFPGINDQGRVTAGAAPVLVPGAHRPGSARRSGGPTIQGAPELHAFRTNVALTVRQDLGTLGGFFSDSFGINSSGQVSGAALPASGGLRAFRYADSEAPPMRNLGVLPGGSLSVGFRINDPGAVVGYAERLISTPEGPLFVHRAFRWTEAGGMQDLGALLPAFPDSRAIGINQSSQVVGQVSSFTVARAWRFTDGPGMVLLDPTSQFTFSIAYDINDASVPETVGEVATGPGPSISGVQAFRHTDLTGIVPLGVLSGDQESRAFATNDAGIVVGDSGPVISSRFGFGPAPTFMNRRAFVYSDAQGMRDLNTLIPPSSPWVLAAATDINNAGQITGIGTLSGVPAVFRLTPTGSGDTEPPVIEDCDLSPTAVPASGDLVTINALVLDNVGVASVLARIRNTALGVDETVHLDEIDTDTFEGSYPAAANSTGSPEVYTVTLQAFDTSNNQVSESCGSFVVAAGGPDTSPPVVSKCDVSPRTVPSFGGDVVIQTIVTDNVAVSSVQALVEGPGFEDTVHLELLKGGPAGGIFGGSFVAPENTDSSPLVLSVTIFAGDSSGNSDQEDCGTVTVLPPDLDPPVVSDCTVSPRTLPTTGGTITIEADVSDNEDVTSVLAEILEAGSTSPDQITLSRIGTTDRFRGTFTVSPSSSERPLDFSITVVAFDFSENFTEEDCGIVTVTEAAPGAGELSVSASRLTFGDICLGNFAVRSFVVTNTGDGVLTGTIGGAGSPFTVLVPSSGGVTPGSPGGGGGGTPGGSGTPFSLSPGESLRVRVRFIPRAERRFSSSLLITSSDSDTPTLRVSVSGRGCRRRSRR